MARKNPYETKGKARFIGNDVWSYRDFEIRTSRAKAANKGFAAEIQPLKPFTDPHAYWLEELRYAAPVMASDEASAIELARIYIDKAYYHDSLSPEDQRLFENVDQQIAASIQNAKTYSKDVSRATVSRDFQHAADEWKTGIHKRRYDFWTGIPLQDRLRWIDTEIKLFKLAHGLPISNPPKKAKGRTTRKKNAGFKVISEDPKSRMMDTLSRLYNRPEDSEVSYTRSFPIYQELQKLGFVKISYQSQPFQDREATLEEGYLPQIHIKAHITPKGRQFIERSGAREQYERRIATAASRLLDEENPKKTKGAPRRKNPKIEVVEGLTSVGGTILGRLYEGPEDGNTWPRGLKEHEELERRGLIKIDFVGKAYQDPDAGPDEGEVLLIPIKAHITRKGLRFFEESGLKKIRDSEIDRMVKKLRGGAVDKLPPKNPRKKAKKKSPTAEELVAKCRKLWAAYCKKPGVTKLRAVDRHCEAMKVSKAKSVKAERTRCMRSVRAEAKLRGWKI